MLNLPQNPKWDIARVSHSTLVNADCFDVFPLIADKSVDAIIADLPYGTTQNKWDSVLPLDELWNEYKRILKPNGVVLLFGAEPFSSVLRLSNLKQYKYDWYWVKNKKTGFLNARKMPMQQVESISVFKDKIGDTYNPIKELRTTQKAGNKKYGNTPNYGKQDAEYVDNQSDYILPANVLNIKTERGLHPTQKPLDLMEYLIKTYTNENDMVLDNTMGSGTTNLACLKLNRKSIGIEKEKQYYDVAVRRLSSYCG
jgi:site-specific DNA-methyltransferase (adenine-specific)